MALLQNDLPTTVADKVGKKLIKVLDPRPGCLYHGFEELATRPIYAKSDTLLGIYVRGSDACTLMVGDDANELKEGINREFFIKAGTTVRLEVPYPPVVSCRWRSPTLAERES